jgi:hypothetical protein
MKILRFTCAALLLSAPVFAQEAMAWKQREAELSAPNQDEAGRKQAVEVMLRVPFEKAIKGAPYSAETVVESSQTLADGNRITRKTTGAVYRDGEGRTRREEEAMVSTATPRVSSRGQSVSIVDPVAGFSYSLDPENKIAWKTPIGGANTIMSKVEGAQVDEYKKTLAEKMAAERKAGATDEQSKAAANEEKAKAIAAAGGRGGGAGVPAGGAVAVRTRGGIVGTAIMAPDTPLEHKTLEGVAVEGRKTTTVIPAGQVGNEQPITVVSEEWRSPDLNLLVLTRHSDPRTGESSYRLQNIIRAEPDPSLFMVPSDYTVRETGIRRMEPFQKN